MLQEGHRKLSDEVKHLKLIERPGSSRRSKSRAPRRPCANAEYHAAKERQGHVEATVADVRQIVAGDDHPIRPPFGQQGRVWGDGDLDRRGEEKGPLPARRAGRGGTPRSGGSATIAAGRALIGRQKGDESRCRPVGRPLLRSSEGRVRLEAGVKLRPTATSVLTAVTAAAFIVITTLGGLAEQASPHSDQSGAAQRRGPVDGAAGVADAAQRDPRPRRIPASDHEFAAARPVRARG